MLAALLPGCARHHADTTPGPTTPVRLALEDVSTTLNYPVFLTSPPGDVHRLFVLEKTGRIQILEDGVELASPFLDVSSLVSTGDEQGLLSLAFPSDYAATGRFYIGYTDVNGSTVVARYHVSADPDVADPSGEILLTAPHPEPSHNGGMIAFGPDHMLYVGIGDGHGQTGGDPTGTGQDNTDLLGDLLRIDVSGASGYVPAAGNPFTAPDRPEIWSYGLRNPWRFSFDRATGDLYLGDVGQYLHEEVDIATAAAGRGKGLNFGWNRMEGADCFSPANGCDESGLAMPVLTYDHPSAGACRAVVSGYVYRGSAMPELRGTYFYGDYCTAEIHTFRYTGGLVTSKADWPDLDTGHELTSFGEDARGELYIMNSAGRLARIVRAP